jgi:AraC family transcriptional regulator
VRRTGAGQLQETTPRTGTIWLTPTWVEDDETTITAPLPETMHLYLSTTLFDRLSDDFHLPGTPAHSIRYVAGVHDELIGQLALAIRSEMMNASAAGRMLIETASLMLAARLIHRYCDSGSCAPVAPVAHELDHGRLRRVLDHISAHLSDEITVADLARVACLSMFHFARMFTRAIGMPPHRYVSRMRLEKSMVEIMTGSLPLSQIAMNARFSSQASFTRAFRRATGLTPGEYRRRRR